MRITITSLLFIHGLIHIIGFTKAYRIIAFSQLHLQYSKLQGAFWFVTGLLFIVAAILLFKVDEHWWALCIAATILSQILIVTNWADARYGTVVNLLLLPTVVAGFATWAFTNQFKREAQISLKANHYLKSDLLTEKDAEHLPMVVKKYLYYSGVIGKPKVHYFKVTFKGQIRDKKHPSNWMPFTSVQYNSVEKPARMFFMKATMHSLPVSGFHCYKNGRAFMDIRLLSLFKVQYQAGPLTDTAETVTFFNDMCCMAPATLIDKRIKWLRWNEHSAEASFTSHGITITAELHFDQEGKLISFESDDRYAAVDNQQMQKLLWETPLHSFKQYNGYNLPSKAEAIYKYPDGDFSYGRFELTSINYNPSSL